MARVYLAELVAAGGFRRKCALKVVHPEFARDQKFIELMQREARLGALLDHPNIVNTISYGDVDGVHFIDLEYVEGKTLDEFLEMMRTKGKHGLDMGFCLQIILPILRGLDYAHSFTDEKWEGPPGLVHRDLKPANIMLSNQAVVKIMDFGIAKARAGRTNLTSIGQVRGTPVYMAPEQVTGKEVDGRSDQFAAATVFYELATGKRLFSGINLVTVMQTVATADTSAAETLLGSRCLGLGEVLARMWRRNPEERFETCADAAIALGTVLESHLAEPEEVRPRKSRPRKGERSRKKKATKARPLMFGLLSALTGKHGRKGRKRGDTDQHTTGVRRKKRRKRKTTVATEVDSDAVLESAEDWSKASAQLESKEYMSDLLDATEALPGLPAAPVEHEEITEALESGRTISMLFMDEIFESDGPSGSGKEPDIDDITTVRNQKVVTETSFSIDNLPTPGSEPPASDGSDSEHGAGSAAPLDKELAEAALQPAVDTGETPIHRDDDEAADQGKGGQHVSISDTLDLNPLAKPRQAPPTPKPSSMNEDGNTLDDFFLSAAGDGVPPLEDDGSLFDEAPPAEDDSSEGDSSEDGEDDFFGSMEEADDGDDDDDFFTGTFED